MSSVCITWDIPVTCEYLPDLPGHPKQAQLKLVPNFAGHAGVKWRHAALAAPRGESSHNKRLHWRLPLPSLPFTSSLNNFSKTPNPSNQQTQWTNSSRCSARTSTTMLLPPAPPPNPPQGLPAARSLAATPTMPRALSYTPTLATSPSLSSRIRPRG